MRKAAILVAAGVAALAAGCGSAPAAPSDPGPKTAPPSLTTSVAAAGATWGIVVMGGAAASENNFWQLFTRPAGSSRWTLVTPPGVADNGGLVAAPAGGSSLVTGVRPSQGLRFSPLATTADGGRTWSPTLLDAGLANDPDALAVAPGGREYAMLGDGAIDEAPASQTPASQTPGEAGSTALARPGAVGASPAGRRCGLASPSAITVTPSGGLLAGGACDRPGVTGIFGYADGTWHAAAPATPPGAAGDRIQVLRLTSTATGNVAVLLAGRNLFAAWTADGGSRWAVSPPLRLDTVGVTSVAFGSSAVGVLPSGGRPAVIGGPGASWQTLPAAPPDTAVLALTPAAGTKASIGPAQVQALAAKGATLTVWQLTGPATRWAKSQTIKIPVQYGTSS